LIVIQLVLPIHECAAGGESAAKSLHFVANPVTADAALTETSCLCVQV
jgi:hypothetical protein